MTTVGAGARFTVVPDPAPVVRRCPGGLRRPSRRGGRPETGVRPHWHGAWRPVGASRKNAGAVEAQIDLLRPPPTTSPRPNPHRSLELIPSMREPAPTMPWTHNVSCTLRCTSKRRLGRLDQIPHGRRFVSGEIVQNHDVAGSQMSDQVTTDPRDKADAIHGAPPWQASASGRCGSHRRASDCLPS